MNFLKKFLKNPIGLFKRVFFKLFVGPSKYGTENGYKAEEYWKDRFDKYGMDIRGPGEEGLTPEENEEMYQKESKILFEHIQSQGIDFKNNRVLEIGLGNGYYTRLINEKDAQNYTGLDITDTLFEEHQKINSNFKFLKGDITENAIEGQFDCIMMIDVIQHIVEEDKLRAAMSNLYKMLAPGGKLFLNPIQSDNKKHFFYLASWSIDVISPQFPDCQISDLIEFRLGDMVIITKN